MNTRSMAVAALLSACGASTQAQAPAATVAPGPYYATPSWDQKLPSATRFITLGNWASRAVLDRETGLVWEAAPRNTVHETYFDAYVACLNSTTGARAGWRVPTIEELLRTLVVGTNGEPINDSPFALWGGGFIAYWSSTTRASDARHLAAVNPAGGVFTSLFDVANGNKVGVWCVQSPAAGGPLP